MSYSSGAADSDDTTLQPAELTFDQLDQLSATAYQRLAQFIENDCGIKLPTSKKTMVEGRLRRRTRELGLATLEDYVQYVLDEGGMEDEYYDLIDVISTNKTDFFREPVHFRYLVEKAIPELLSSRLVSRTAPLKAWSAACSTGAEPYTLAMVLADQAARHNFRFSILATDICFNVLQTAAHAVYSETMVEPVPLDMRRRFLLRSRQNPDTFRIVPDLRQCVRFARFNLMEMPYDVPADMHLIFVRNVLIYFEKDVQRRVLAELARHLRPGGYLVLGHSETLSGEGMPLTPVATTVFRRQ